MVQSILKTFAENRLDKSLPGTKMTVETAMGEPGILHQRVNLSSGKSIPPKALGRRCKDGRIAPYGLVVSHARKPLNYDPRPIA